MLLSWNPEKGTGPPKQFFRRACAPFLLPKMPQKRLKICFMDRTNAYLVELGYFCTRMSRNGAWIS